MSSEDSKKDTKPSKETPKSNKAQETRNLNPAPKSHQSLPSIPAAQDDTPKDANPPPSVQKVIQQIPFQQKHMPIEIPSPAFMQSQQDMPFDFQDLKMGKNQLLGTEKMKKAYRAATTMSQKLMEDESPEDLKYLREVGDSDVIVIKGCYDHGQAIFELAGIPYTLVTAQDISGIDLREDQIIFVNCPGSDLTTRGLERIRSFVNNGGLLVTTDWSLKNVLEPAFTGYIRYNGQATADEVVRIVYEPVEDTFLKGLLDPEDTPQWWLEGSSYPIEILKPDQVTVLVSSKEMGEKYGESPIVVAFEYGKGKVYHMTSHFYLQRVETRTARHEQKASAYAAQKGLATSTFGQEEAEILEEIDVASVEAAYTSVRSVQNIIVEQKMRVKNRKKEST